MCSYFCWIKQIEEQISHLGHKPIAPRNSGGSAGLFVDSFAIWPKSVAQRQAFSLWSV